MIVDAATSRSAPQRSDPPAAPPAAAAPSPTPSRAELEAAADRVQHAGDGDAKAQALAAELAPLDRESRATLMALVARDAHLGTGLGSEWLSARHLNELVDSGVLSRADQGLIAEAFATAYNRASDTCLLDPSTGIDHAQAHDFLQTDTPFGEYFDNVNRVSSFLNSGSGPAMDRFVGHYAQRELEMATEIDHSYSNLRAETALHLLNGAGSAALTTQVLDRLGADRRAQVYELLSHAPPSDPRDGRLLRGWASSDDALAIAAEAVGRQPGLGETQYIPGVPYPVGTESQVTTGDRLALEMTRWFSAHRDTVFHGDHADPARAQALNQLLTGHTRYLLDTLTEPKTGTVRRDGQSQPENIDDLQALSTLVRAAMLSSEVPSWRQQQAKDELLGYARAQVDAYPTTPDSEWSPAGRLGVLLGAMQGAVAQGYGDLESQRAGREAVVGFFTDLLVGQLADGAGKLTPQGRLAQIVGGELIDAASDQGKAFLREKITDFLFGPEGSASQDELQAAMNELTNIFVQALPNEMEDAVRGGMDSVRDALNDAG